MILCEATAVEVGVYYLAEWSGMGLVDPVAANGPLPSSSFLESGKVWGGASSLNADRCDQSLPYTRHLNPTSNTSTPALNQSII